MFQRVRLSVVLWAAETKHFNIYNHITTWNFLVVITITTHKIQLILVISD